MKSVLILIFLSIGIAVFPEVSEEEYLKSNVHLISLQEYRGENFKYLDNEEEVRVFFSGETHGFQENYQLRIQLIRYFYEKHGIRRYLGELGYSSGYFLNKYLKTGEEKYLELVNYSLEGSYDFSVEDYEFWKELYNYNRTLPEGEEIKIYGLDMEHQYWIPLLAVHDILEKVEVEELAPEDREGFRRAKVLFKEVHDMILPPGEDYKNIYRNVEEIIKKNKLRYRRDDILDAFKTSRMNFILGRTAAEKYYTSEELVDIEAIIFNALNTIEFLNLKANEEIYFYMREKFIFENFIRLFKAFPQDEFYGQWGRFHISGREDSNEIRFAQLVEDFAPDFYRSITAIEFLYNDKDHPDYRKKGVREKLSILRRHIPEGAEAAIFNLKDLPEESGLLDKREKRYIKYIVVINSSRKAEKLRE